MSWKETNKMSERVKFVIRAVSGKEKLKSLCREFGIDRSTGRRWRKRFEESGDVRELKEYSRAPKRKPRKTEEELELKVVELREKYGWGSKKLEVLLRDEGIELSRITIDRIIKRRGLTREKEIEGKAVERFEKANANDLWQMDFKGPFTVGERVCHPLSILDDHSRYAVGLYPLKDQMTESVKSSVIRTFKEYGVPQAMLMDRGTPWWSYHNGYGLTRLAVSLIKQDIKILHGRVRHPQTQGKVERFHRTMKEAVKHKRKAKNYKDLTRILKEFHEEYNNIRPHEALNMETPKQRYSKSTKEYNPKPKKWLYPEGSLISKVDTLGSISFKGARFFISEALVGEHVCLQPIEKSYILSFRNMYIRQVYPSMGKSTAVLFPIDYSHT